MCLDSAGKFSFALRWHRVLGLPLSVPLSHFIKACFVYSTIEQLYICTLVISINLCSSTDTTKT